MLPFDGKDADGLEDTGLSAQSTQEDDRLERLVFKHRHGRGSCVRNDDTFEGGRFSTESSLLERTLEIQDRSYRLKIEPHNGGESRASEARERPADEFVGNAAGVDEPIDDEGAATSSDGEEFSRDVKEAAEILRMARECMMARADEETADALLYRSARLLSTAVALRPTSLVAVGQLGNTYLLHGELKLKISREMRKLLAKSGAYLNGRERVSRSRKLDRRILSRENISSALVGVCEECESLLIEAGRSYRMAVSIDSVMSRHYTIGDWHLPFVPNYLPISDWKWQLMLIGCIWLQSISLMPCYPKATLTLQKLSTDGAARCSSDPNCALRTTRRR